LEIMKFAVFALFVAMLLAIVASNMPQVEAADMDKRGMYYRGRIGKRALPYMMEEPFEY
ncbi:hypothetical protein Ciccas_013507, partial [Cichlidogyrus casuarinus]